MSLILAYSFMQANAATDPPAYEEHLSHHPELQAETATQPSGPGNSTAGVDSLPPGMVMDPRVMSKMMEQMRAPKPRDLYPSLMAMGDLDDREAEAARGQSDLRIEEGYFLFSESVKQLTAVFDATDSERMERAVDEALRGLRLYRSGLATHRALNEGVLPREIALTWFKTEMGLLPVSGGRSTPLIFGMSPLHTGIMLIFVLATMAFLWAYLFKMRRSAELLGELTANPIERAGQMGVFVTPTETPEEQKPTAPLSKRQTWTGELEVIGLFRETPNVTTFRLALPDRAALPFAYEPGQFATLRLDIDGTEIKRSYTISSSPTQRDYIELTIKREEDGQVSRFMHDQVHQGQRLAVTTPLGRFYFNGTQADSVVLIAGGVGVTPMMSAIRYLTDHGWPGDIYLVYGCKSPHEIIFRSELERLAERHANLHIHITISQPAGTGWSGATGRIDADVLRVFVPHIDSRRVHICGPNPMMDATKFHLESLGVSPDNIKLEAFGSAPPKTSQPKSVIAVASSEAITQRLRFSRSDRTTQVEDTRTILEAAEAIGVDIDSSCRVGTCGSCIVKLLAGEVTMAVDDALEAEDKEGGYILACQARMLRDCEVDA